MYPDCLIVATACGFAYNCTFVASDVCYPTDWLLYYAINFLQSWLMSASVHRGIAKSGKPET